MSLDEHYDRAAVERKLASAQELAEGDARRIERQAGQWNDALAEINNESGPDFRRFVAAMRKGRNKNKPLPGAKFHLVKRLPGLGTRALSYWELSKGGAFVGEDRSRHWHGTLVLTESAELVIDVWSRPNRERRQWVPGPVSRHTRFSRKMPTVLLQRVDKSMATPPTSSEIGAALAALLHAHSILID